MKKIIIKRSSKYGKIIDSTRGYVFYKDRPTEVDDDYEFKKSELELFGLVEKTKPKKTKQKKNELDELIHLKGIGKERLADLKRQFSSMKSLKKALLNNKVGLRNDVVKTLKRYFKRKKWL